MRKQIKPDQRQEKIDQILALMTGKLKPADLPPRLAIHFNTACGNIYMINNQSVDMDTFHDLLRTLPVTTPMLTTGREDENEEYYY